MTKILMFDGEDRLLTIEFPDKKSTDHFMESVRKKGYENYNGIYHHPKNDMSKIAVKAEGNVVKIIAPFEMVPYDF